MYFRETIFLKNDSNEIMFVMKEKKKGFDSMLEEYEMADEEHLY